MNESRGPLFSEYLQLNCDSRSLNPLLSEQNAMRSKNQSSRKKQLRSREYLPNRRAPFNRTSRLSYHHCLLNSCGMYLRVMRRHTAEARRFTHLHANRLIGIRHTTGYGMTSRPESHNAASTRPRAETSLLHSCNKWYHPARHLLISLNHLTSECRMYH